MTDGAWWPNRRIPPGSTPRPTMTNPEPTGSSGSLSFDSSNVSQTDIETSVVGARSLCNVDYMQAEPCVLTLGVLAVASSGQGLEQVTQIDLAAGQNGQAANPDVANGFVVVTYGVGASRQRVCIDMASGSFQLPPCTQVRVEALAWYNSGSSGAFVAVNVTGAITRGMFGKRRATNTAWLDLPGASPITIPIPDGARDVDLWGAEITTIGVGQPVLTLSGACGVPSLVRDYSLGIWAPPFPGAMFGIKPSNTVAIDSNVATAAWLQFGIEF